MVIHSLLATNRVLYYRIGGSAACITAGRLAAADSSLKILVGEEMIK
jgi:hypothetical protein